jgi:MscS family membrane protein
MIYTFTRTTSWVEFHEIQQEVMLKIANIISAHGAELALPMRALRHEIMPAALAFK